MSYLCYKCHLNAHIRCRSFRREAEDAKVKAKEDAEERKKHPQEEREKKRAERQKLESRMSQETTGDHVSSSKPNASSAPDTHSTTPILDGVKA